VSGDLYGDEALFDELLRTAMETQPCQKCGYEVGIEEEDTDEEGVLKFKPLRFRKICMHCRQDAENARDERLANKKPRRKSKRTIEIPAALFEAKPSQSPGAVLPPTWDELYAMIGMAR
jgi:hypothetical protein